MARLVPLWELVAEGFGETPADMFTLALNRGLAMGIDGGGHHGLRVPDADKLRQERYEQEARAAREAELRRQEAQDAEVAAMVARESQAQLREREQRVVDRTGGVPLWQIDREMRRVAYLAPSTGGSVEERDRIANRQYTIDDYEQFVIDTYGPDALDPAP